MPICDEHPVLLYRMIEHVGGTYVMVAGLGSAFHLIKGISDWSAHGHLDVAGVARAVRTNVPRIAAGAGGFAGVVCAIESAVSRARGRDNDNWNMVAAGAAAFGLDSARRGGLAAARSTLLGATVYSGLGAFMLYFDRHTACARAPTYRPLPTPVPVIKEYETGRLEGRQILLYG